MATAKGINVKLEIKNIDESIQLLEQLKEAVGTVEELMKKLNSLDFEITTSINEEE